MSPYNAMQNTREEIDDLTGSTIEKAWAATWDDGFEKVRGGVVKLRIRFRDGLRVNGSNRGEYELWQDPEGNGPGFLAYQGPISEV